MRFLHTTMNIEDAAVATIAVARDLEAAISNSAVDFGHDTARIRAMLDAFRGGHLYREAEDAALDAAQARVLGILSDRVPGYRSIALNHDTTDYWFLDEELEAIRKVWEQLRLFRSCRQRVFDEVAAECQLSALRHRYAVHAAE